MPLFAFVCASAILLAGQLAAAPRRYQDEDASTAMREMRDSIESLRHEVNNHETEIRQIEQRAENQESTISSLRQQVMDANQANKELVKGSSSSQESKVASLEATNKGLIADITQLRTHANESATVMAQSKQKIVELERLIEQQNQNIDNLQAALRSLMEAMNTTSKTVGSISTEASSSSSDKIYKVKNGDSLEKIARAHNTTVRAIKDLNQLSNDRINVGQTLQMP